MTLDILQSTQCAESVCLVKVLNGRGFGSCFAITAPGGALGEAAPAKADDAAKARGDAEAAEAEGSLNVEDIAAGEA